MNLLQMIAENLDGVSTEGLDIKGVDGDILEILQSQNLIQIRNSKIFCPYKVESYGNYLMKVFLECPEHLRLGQWAVVLFNGKFPKVKIFPEIDPFNQDDNLPRFLEFVAKYASEF